MTAYLSSTFVRHRRTFWRFVRIGLAIGLSALFVDSLVSNLDWRAVSVELFRASPGWLLIAFAVVLTHYGLRAMRWWILAKGVGSHLTYQQCLWPFLGTTGMNNVLPFRAGDAVRVFAYGSNLGIKTSQIAGTVLIERIQDVFGVFVWFAVGLAYLPAGVVPAEFIDAAWLMLAVLFVGLLVMLLMPRPLLGVIRYIIGRPGIRGIPLVHTVFDWTGGLLETLPRICSPVRLTTTFVMTVLGWGIEGIAYACVAVALSLNDTGLGPWFSMAMGNLSAILPSLPGSIGIFDFFVNEGMIYFGASIVAAASFVLLVRLIIYVPITIFALVYSSIFFGKALFSWAPVGSAER